ncbi:site-specific integrase [Acidiphilium sp.]|uniref:site-specific integrase n=1 Tax=Acidiphilium sp. TaxID=527 RepID=UPI00258FAEBD|nr:site-specific integrase [Acidiphilium sp.]
MRSTAVAPRPLSLPFNQWPESDQRAWAEITALDLLGIPLTRVASWSPGTQQLAKRDYGAWLRFLAERRAAFYENPPATRFQRDLMVEFIRAEQQRLNNRSIALRLACLFRIAINLDPTLDWSWFRDIVNRACRHAASLPRPIKPLYSARSVIAAGQKLIDDSYGLDDTLVDPVAFRDGLILMLLTAMPVRITPFSAIDIGKHLRQGDNGQWTLHWAPEETKTRHADFWTIPPALASALDAYLAHVRPALLTRSSRPTSSSKLWIGMSGSPIGTQTLRKIIKLRTATAFGRPINPHLFRTVAASSYVIDHTDRAIEAAGVLGHASFRTTEMYYLSSRRHTAITRAHVTLAHLRTRR